MSHSWRLFDIRRLNSWISVFDGLRPEVWRRPFQLGPWIDKALGAVDRIMTTFVGKSIFSALVFGRSATIDMPIPMKRRACCAAHSQQFRTAAKRVIIKVNERAMRSRTAI